MVEMQADDLAVLMVFERVALMAAYSDVIGVVMKV